MEKQKKLAYVARRYYLDDQKQSDIAQELGVSRPLISRMLSEARELGIVEITVHEPGAQSAGLMDRLRLSGSIHGGVLVEDGEDNDATNRQLSQGAVELLGQLGMGVLMKVIPQINVFSINIELKVIIGLALLLLLMAPFSEYLLEAEMAMLDSMHTLLGLL